VCAIFKPDPAGGSPWGIWNLLFQG
jgi:hypothetical protein